MAYADKKDTIRYNNQFNAEHYDRVGIMLPRGMKERLKEYASSRGQSVNTVLVQMICDMLERDGTGSK